MKVTVTVENDNGTVDSQAHWNDGMVTPETETVAAILQKPLAATLLFCIATGLACLWKDYSVSQVMKLRKHDGFLYIVED